MNSLIKKLLATEKNLSLLVLNESLAKPNIKSYVSVIVPSDMQLTFLQLYTNKPSHVFNALSLSGYAQNDRWYPISRSDSPVGCMNEIDKLVSYNLVDLSMNEMVKAMRDALKHVFSTEGNCTIKTYPQLMGFSS